MSHPSSFDGTRWSVIARAAQGDPVARSSFARSYLAIVRTFLEARWRSTPLESDVDDAVQQVFLECLREDGVLARADPKRGDLRGLLFGVASNVARRREERAGRQRGETGHSVFDAVPANEASLSVLFDREWARTMVHLAGELMRERAERDGAGARLRVDLLRLRFTEGLPIREIAAQWEIEPASVHKAYEKAREEFRECLRQVVREHAARSEDALDEEVARIVALLD